MSGRVIRIQRPTLNDAQFGDEALAAAAATGDPAAVGALFDRFQPMVTRYLSRILGGGPEIEDLVQATFVVVARGTTRFDQCSKASTWLLGIATNVARHHRRSLERRGRFLDRFKQTHLARRINSPNVDNEVDVRRVLRRLERILAEQTEERRLAFVLCEIEGLPAREAAEVLSTSEAAIWKRVSDTRRDLKRALDEGEGG